MNQNWGIFVTVEVPGENFFETGTGKISGKIPGGNYSDNTLKGHEFFSFWAPASALIFDKLCLSQKNGLVRHTFRDRAVSGDLGFVCLVRLRDRVTPLRRVRRAVDIANGSHSAVIGRAGGV
ncbi:MAG: hypothetical protein RIB59_16190 [Rhodospirillales bacterium]